MADILKKTFFLFLMMSMISLSACDKHILKKLKNRSKTAVPSSTDISSDNDEPVLTANLNGDLTGIPNKKNKVYMVASIKRTPCLGSCSIYEAKLYSDGKATFFGRKNVNLKGRYEGQITPKQMKSLIEKIHEVDFFNLESSYPIDDKKGVTENSKTITTIQLGDQIKKIKTNNEGPEKLVAFENYLDELFDRMQWSSK